MGIKKIRSTFKIMLILGIMILLSWVTNYSQNVNSEPQPPISFSQSKIGELTLSTALSETLKDYDHWVQELVDQNKVPGAAIAIVKGKHVIHLKGYGLRSSKGQEAVDENTIFRLASVSKGFASILAGTLEEKGYLQLDDKVSKHLPDFHLTDTLNSDDLTIKNLLSHTTGLQRHAYTDLIESGSDYNEMLLSIQELPLIGPVGKYYSYQNVIYSLVGDVAKQTTGESYESLLKKHVFDPAGMSTASSSFEDIKQNPNVAYPHVRTSRGWRPTKINETYYNVKPAAGVNASAKDMSQWLITLMGYHPAVITSPTLEKIYTPVVQTPKRKYRGNWPHIKKAYYAMGWRILDLEDHQLVYHGGYVNQYRAEIAFDPEEEIGIVILANAPSQLSNRGISKFLKAYYQIEGDLVLKAKL